MIVEKGPSDWLRFCGMMKDFEGFLEILSDFEGSLKDC